MNNNLLKSPTTYIEIATDGAITKKTHSAGIGVVLRYINNNEVAAEAHFSKNLSYEGVTSQVAELTAIVDAPVLLYGFLEYINETFNTSYTPDSLTVKLYSDSAYCINCFEGVNGSKPWFLKWMRNDWKNNAGADVSNKDLWVELLGSINNTFMICMSNKLNRSDIDDISKDIITQSQSSKLTLNLIKVKGHSGHELNEIADDLAVNGKKMEANHETFVIV